MSSSYGVSVGKQLYLGNSRFIEGNHLYTTIYFSDAFLLVIIKSNRYFLYKCQLLFARGSVPGNISGLIKNG